MKKTDRLVHELCITGLGLVTSVGHDYKTACASIRAGLKRSKKLKHFFVPNKKGYESFEEGLVTGHPVIDDPPENKMDRLMELFSTAFMDLKEDSGLDEETLITTPVFLCLPGRERCRLDVEEIVDRLLLIETWPFWGMPPVKVYTQGHAGMLFALSDAALAIQTGEIERAVVAGADCLFGFDDLHGFMQTERLKTSLNVDGFIPGEAASAFLVERTTLAQKRRVPIKSMVRVISTAYSSNRFMDSGLDAGLEQVIRDILAPTSPIPTVVGAVISDLNGEPWRFRSWGMIQSRLFHKIAGEKTSIFPAKCLGDTGAASSGIAICMAARAMERGYLSGTPNQLGSNALVLSSSDTGERAALLLGPYAENNI